MATDVSVAWARFAAGLDTAGHLPHPAWRAAFTEVPRHALVRRLFLPTPDGRWRAVDPRHSEYVAHVYSDTALITQLNGANPDPDWDGRPVTGVATFREVQPSLLAYMLHALHLSGTERVGEIGTGIGYTAALLCHRLADVNVTTVASDPVTADRARIRLAACTYRPVVDIDDGSKIDAGGYDRLIATRPARSVPASWIAQVRDGGLILASMGHDIDGGALVRLAVNNGTAHGFFLPSPGATARTCSLPQATPAMSDAIRQGGDARTAQIGKSALVTDGPRLWITLLVPDVTWQSLASRGGNPQVWLFAPDGSWAALDETTMRVVQHGPRRLWDEVEAAHHLWKGSGAPARDRIRLTVTPDGTHQYWLDNPENELWTDTISN